MFQNSMQQWNNLLELPILSSVVSWVAKFVHKLFLELSIFSWIGHWIEFGWEYVARPCDGASIEWADTFRVMSALISIEIDWH